MEIFGPDDLPVVFEMGEAQIRSAEAGDMSGDIAIRRDLTAETVVARPHPGASRTLRLSGTRARSAVHEAAPGHASTSGR